MSMEGVGESRGFGESVINTGKTVLHGLKTGCDVVVESFSRTDILAKISGLAVKVLNLLQNTLNNLPEYVSLVATQLKNLAPVLSTIECGKSIYSCVTKAYKSSWQSIVSQVAYIFSSLIGVLKFGDQLGIVNFGSLSLAVGGEKVVSVAGSSLSLVGASFGLVNDISELIKEPESDEHGYTLEEKKAHWEGLKKEIVENHQAIFSDDKKASFAFLTKVWNAPLTAEPLTPVAADVAQVAYDSLNAGFSMHYSLAKINRRIQKYENKLANASMAKTKTWMSFADNIAKIVVGILGLVALGVGITCLAPTALPMIIVGVALTSYSLFRSIYGMCQKEKELPSQSQEEKAAWRVFKTNFRDATTVFWAT